MSKDLALNAGKILEEIRKKSPLIWNFSNFVSMDIAANALLAIGASPAMAHAKEEANDFSQICKAINGALTINIGTFDPYWQECAVEAARLASTCSGVSGEDSEIALATNASPVRPNA